MYRTIQAYTSHLAWKNRKSGEYIFEVVPTYIYLSGELCYLLLGLFLYSGELIFQTSLTLTGAHLQLHTYQRVGRLSM